MHLRLEVAWVAGGNLGGYRALGRVTGSGVSFMLNLDSAAGDGEQGAVQPLAAVQEEQRGSCALTSVICLVLCLDGVSD